ncbi:HTH_Tnp_Tc3_2 domain-containing protein [Trichonephila clavipes]|nr:HTH_Tnp_Tc3_2 domain-containing protein [Trichonephila clavipes]
MTIHRPLIEQNLRSYQPLRHLPLTPAHCRVRLQWCLARSGDADWGRIVLSDESRFQLCPDVHRRRAFHYCTSNTPSNRNYDLGCHLF